MKKNLTPTPLVDQLNGWERFKSTNFWQAAFVRPFPPGKDKWKTRAASTLSYAFGIFLLVPLMSAALINDYMTDAIPLESMHKTTGVLESVALCFRCTPLFEIRQQSGELIEFYSYPGQLNKLKPYVGTKISVWSQTGFRIPTQIHNPNFFVEQISEIQIHQSREYLMQYLTNRNWIMEYHKRVLWWHFGFLLVGILLPFRVLWKYRKPI